MKKLFPFVCFLLVLACRSEQDVEPANEPTFMRYYGSEHNHSAHVAIEAHNGFTMLSTVQIAKDNLGRFVYKIRMIHTDQYGNELWNKEYPSFESEFDGIKYHIGDNGSFKASSFIALNSGYLIVGERINTRTNGSEYSDLLLIETDANGEPVREKSLTLNGPSLHGKALQADGSGNVYVLGNITETTNDEDMFLAKLSGSSYDSLWSRQYGNGTNKVTSRLFLGESQNIFWGHTVKFDNQPDEDIRLLGAPENSASANRPMEFGAKGFNESVADFAVIPGGYLVVGTTDENIGTNGSVVGGSNIYVLKSSTEGQIVFKPAPIDFDDQNDFGNAICEGVNGGALILATVQSGPTKGNGKEDLYLCKLNAAFDEKAEWEINYGGPDKETGASVCKTSDGGYLVYGTTSFGNLQKLILMKVKSDGKL
jgi:hypothetical protein